LRISNVLAVRRSSPASELCARDTAIADQPRHTVTT